VRGEAAEHVKASREEERRRAFLELDALVREGGARENRGGGAGRTREARITEVAGSGRGGLGNRRLNVTPKTRQKRHESREVVGKRGVRCGQAAPHRHDREGGGGGDPDIGNALVEADLFAVGTGERENREHPGPGLLRVAESYHLLGQSGLVAALAPL